MPSYTDANARISIALADTPELADMLANGSDTGGEVMLRGALEQMLGQGTLFLDGLRRRPRFFDGRFLTGADLTRDQDYVRQRQADMARAAGSGVISGLMVRDADIVQGDVLTISAGHGITPEGDLVMLATARQVPLMDLAVSRQLDAVMGLSVAPNSPLSSRSGVFILGLRPVEFTANPIAAYPRTLTGQASIEDGDIIEATAITMTPWPDMGGAATLTEARRAIARQIFGRQPRGMPQNILPLAMVALDRGTVMWIDVAMVRREIGADSGVQVALGTRPRALAEAHLVQHRAHVQDVLAELAMRGPAQIFSASQHFSLLPPAGQMPVGTVFADAGGFQQVYFPPAIDADIAFVPADEIAALVEESLTLPPIDLDGPADELDATGIVILVPVNRQRYQRFAAELLSTSMPVSGDPSLSGKSSAVGMLDALLLRQRKDIEKAERDAALAANAARLAQEQQSWRSKFDEAIANISAPEGQLPMLWYVRRRSVAHRTQTEGLPLAISGDDIVVSAIVNENLGKLKLEKRVAALNAKATPQAAARVMALLGAPRIARSDIFTASVVSDLEKVATGKAEAVLEAVRPLLGAGPAGGRGTGPGRMELPDRTSGTGRTIFARPAFERLATASAEGRSTAARSDTPLTLSVAEVSEIESDYGGVRLGEGIAALESVLGEEWPAPKEALVLGESGLALALDAQFDRLASERLPEAAERVADILQRGDMTGLQKHLVKLADL